MSDPLPESSVHFPKTRQGGVFTDAKNVNLHANDFDWDEVMAGLPDARKDMVDQYLKMCSAELATIGQSKSVGDTEGKVNVSTKKDGKAWENHFATSSHHFPLKNYIIHAFPDLKPLLCAETQGCAILECGCGTGSTLLPLMRECENDKTIFVGFDVSVKAVTHFSQHPIAKEMATKNRLVTFAHDITEDALHSDDSAEPDVKRAKVEGSCSVEKQLSSLCPHLAGVKYDAILLVFVLCALPGVETMVRALQALAAMLKPNGVLLFRDYALPDHNFFRFLEKRGTRMETPLIQKGDGTSQFFFEKNFTVQLFARAGLVEDATNGLTYHCNRIENRKNGKRMDKIFINGAFRIRREK